jgi:hypothetical protein
MHLFFICPHAGLAFTFFLDKKSKQKNQAKIITGLSPQGLRARGDFGGPTRFSTDVIY